MADVSWSWCPDCKKWVPAERMNYDVDPDTKKLTRVCYWCLEGVASPGFVYDPYHESAQCIYCDSYSTKHILGDKYVCNECGEEFYER